MRLAKSGKWCGVVWCGAVGQVQVGCRFEVAALRRTDNNKGWRWNLPGRLEAIEAVTITFSPTESPGWGTVASAKRGGNGEAAGKQLKQGEGVKRRGTLPCLRG